MHAKGDVWLGAIFQNSLVEGIFMYAPFKRLYGLFVPNPLQNFVGILKTRKYALIIKRYSQPQFYLPREEYIVFAFLHECLYEIMCSIC